MKGTEPLRRRIVLASGNAGKAREFAALMGGETEIVLQGELGIESVEETGSTFTENALLKARHAAAASGLPALADDSGIEVDRLGGAPGVYSARYAGASASDEENLQKLLAELDGVPESERTARFRCVLVYLRGPDDESPLVAEGRWEGRITTAPSGSNGFGYDPIFFDPESGCTSAELPPATKNVRSHRGRAFARLRTLLGEVREGT